MIQLIGPGGTGKSTVGRELASHLRLRFIDLDHEFSERVGDISDQINYRGYESYALENVRVYLSLPAARNDAVIALSSGFMTYPENINPSYAAIRAEISKSSGTFVLLPSLDREACVGETVRRQIARPFGGPAEKEEGVIRERYANYVVIPAPKIETMRPLGDILKEIIALLPPD
jgi:shikimate kinase